jgi:hypothetical protein
MASPALSIKGKTKMPDALTSEQTIMEIKRIPNQSGERPTFYVNQALIFANQWDVQINFALVHEASPGQFAAVDTALVIMTPEHALSLSKALQKTLDAYTKQQGEIRDIKPLTLPAPPPVEK